MVRPRGWHLAEKHVERRRPRRCRRRSSTSASSSSTTRARWSTAAAGPTSTCPRWRATSRRGCGTTSSSARRRRWASRAGTIKATVLIETLPAAFEMDEILYELREHSAGLNCGRWDYIFSFIKKLRGDPRVRAARPRPGDDGPAVPARLLAAPDQDLPPPRRARHGRHGGADPDQGRPRGATTPRSRRCAPTSCARSKDGHDGTWVAHPGLVPVAREVFDAHMPAPQPDRTSCARTCSVDRGRPAARARGHAHRGRPAPQHPRGRAVPRGLAARPRLRAALQPDGGRGHRRDLARAGLAVDPPRRARSTTAAWSRRRWSARCSTRRCPHCRVAPSASTRALRGRELFERPVHRGRASRSSSPCPPTKP